jgi:hypothetical protein
MTTLQKFVSLFRDYSKRFGILLLVLHEKQLSNRHFKFQVLYTKIHIIFDFLSKLLTLRFYLASSRGTRRKYAKYLV